MKGNRIGFTSLVVGSLALLTFPGTAHAQTAAPVTDCPGRDAPFSIESPLLDILLSERATTAVEQALGVSFDRMPGNLMNTEPPTFAAILTLDNAVGFLQGTPERAAAATEALKQIPVTDADRVARCARYDNEVPEFELAEGRPAILVFEKINGFKDVPSFEAAHAELTAIAARKGWEIRFSDKGGAMTPEVLRQFDAVVWNNISGDVLTLSQRQAFRDFIEGGGGFIGLHGSGGDPAYFWDWYADTLIGARFAGHPSDPQFQDARVFIEDSEHPAAVGLPADWHMTDEWYSFLTNPRDSGARIIARLDESTYSPIDPRFDDNLVMGEDHPIAWSKAIGKGRSFYSAIGHLPETYSHPVYSRMIEDAIAWAAGLNEPVCED